MRPWVIAVGVVLVAGLATLDVAAAIYGENPLWLKIVHLIGNLTVLAVGLVAVLRLAAAAETRSERMQNALEASHERLALIVDSAMDAIITVDETQKIVLFNRAAEQVFRCRKEDMLGQPLDRLLPTRFRQHHRAHIENFGRTGITSRRMGDVTTLWALRADGSEEFPIEASISQASEGGRRFFTVILRDITLRKQTEDALKRQREELRELSAQVLEAREEEKTRIGRELHDELGQLLTALKMDLSWLAGRLPVPQGEVTDKTRKMGETVDRMVQSVRRISADLRPLMLDDLGLADAASWLLDEFGKRSTIECHFELQGERDLSALDKKLANTLYRALQESLTNIARHAEAHHVWVVLSTQAGAIQLEVEDDGRGISPEDLSKVRSLGLKGMRERVTFAGGEIDIARAPRGGTRVRIRVPVEPAQSAEAA